MIVAPEHSDAAPAAAPAPAGHTTEFRYKPALDGLRAIAVLNNTRSPLLPDVPTLAEQGYKDYDLAGWIGLSAPAQTPPAVVKVLADASAKVLSNPALQGKLSGMGMIYEPNSPAEFGKLVADQIGIWSRKARDAGITPE